MKYTQLYRLLSRAERRVLPHCLNDDSVKTTADALNVSEETVRSHRKHIGQKMGVHGKAALRAAFDTLKQEQRRELTE